METLLLELVTIAALLTGYEVPVNQLPSIEFLSAQQLEEIYVCYYKGKNLWEGQSVLGLYSRESEIIFLNENFDKNSVLARGVLLHEIVHYLQDLNDMYSKWKCVYGQPDESEAYRIEARYLENQGVSQSLIDPLKTQSRIFGLCLPPYTNISEHENELGRATQSCPDF